MARINRKRAALARSGAVVAPRGVRGNLGIAAAYERRLMPLIKLMHRDVARGAMAVYKRNMPETDDSAPDAAADARRPPANAAIAIEEFEEYFEEMMEKWGERWAAMSDSAAAAWANAAASNTTVQFTSILREMGFSVRINPSEAARALMTGRTKYNADLIKTIPERYLGRVREMVEESFYAGRDLAGLEARLLESYSITERRARMIARDQTNKATQDLARVEAGECGITEAIWQHMRASEKPRPSHELMDGERFNIDEGCWDPEVGAHIQPGELVNCQCECKWVVPGADSSLGFATQNRLSEEAERMRAEREGADG